MMNKIKNFFKGMAAGIAMLVPGVSGGTMAIILGIYDQLIHSVSTFFKDWKKNFIFLFIVGLGGLTGVLLFSRLMESAMNSFPYVMKFLFMGVIIGGLPVLYRKSSDSGRLDLKSLLFLVIGFAIVLVMSFEPDATTSMATEKGVLSYIFLFIAGIISAVALVLPGISGSYMLLILGLYNLTLNSINTMNIPFLIPLALGIAVGTFGTAKLIEKCLNEYPKQTYMLIIGFVIGSLIEVFPGIPPISQLFASIIVFTAGGVGIYWLGKKGLTD
jgi:putative membrane protein